MGNNYRATTKASECIRRGIAENPDVYPGRFNTFSTADGVPHACAIGFALLGFGVPRNEINGPLGFAAQIKLFDHITVVNPASEDDWKIALSDAIVIRNDHLEEHPLTIAEWLETKVGC